MNGLLPAIGLLFIIAGTAALCRSMSSLSDWINDYAEKIQEDDRLDNDEYDWGHNVNHNAQEDER